MPRSDKSKSAVKRRRKATDLKVLKDSRVAEYRRETQYSAARFLFGGFKKSFKNGLKTKAYETRDVTRNDIFKKCMG